MDTYNVPQKSYQFIGRFYAREVNPFLPKGFPIDEKKPSGARQSKIYKSAN